MSSERLQQSPGSRGPVVLWKGQGRGGGGRALPASSTPSKSPPREPWAPCRAGPAVMTWAHPNVIIPLGPRGHARKAAMKHNKTYFSGDGTVSSEVFKEAAGERVLSREREPSWREAKACSLDRHAGPPQGLAHAHTVDAHAHSRTRSRTQSHHVCCRGSSRLRQHECSCRKLLTTTLLINATRMYS